jgi:ClpX C4-type zinc finger protein
MGWWFKDHETRDAFCSFCTKHYRDVGPLIEGPKRVFICTACIHQCYALLRQEQDQEGKIEPFLVVGSTYCFTTDAASRVGVVRTRLPHPNEHWIQVDLVSGDLNAPAAPTWFNLLHVHTVCEVRGSEADADGSPKAKAAPLTDFRASNRRDAGS